MTKKMKRNLILYPVLLIVGLLIWDQVQFSNSRAEKIFYSGDTVIIDTPKDVHMAAVTIYTNDADMGKALNKKTFTHIRLPEGWTFEKVEAYYNNADGSCEHEDFKGRKYFHCFTTLSRWILDHNIGAIYEYAAGSKSVILLKSIRVLPFAPY